MVVVILSVPLLKQPLGRISLAAIAVSFLGVLVIATRGDLLAFRVSDPLGTVLAVGSALIWATFWLTNVRDDRDEVVKLLLNFAFGLVFVTIAALALSGPPSLDLRGIGGSAYAGVFEMGLTFVLWMRALSLSRTTAQVSNLVYFSPFLSLVLINLIVGETIRAVVSHRAAPHHRRHRPPPLRPHGGGRRTLHTHAPSQPSTQSRTPSVRKVIGPSFGGDEERVADRASQRRDDLRRRVAERGCRSPR